MKPRRTGRSRPPSNRSQESSESMQPRRSRRRKNDDDDVEANIAGQHEAGSNGEDVNDNEPIEITRCICGHDELQTNHISKGQASEIDAGLFIQCDKCQVWQHGFCVGFLSEDEVPEVYFCEKCRPELHIIVQRPWGKTSRYVPHMKAKGLELKENKDLARENEEGDDDINNEEEEEEEEEEGGEEEQKRKEIKLERYEDNEHGIRGTGSGLDEKKRGHSRNATPTSNERSSRRRTLNSRDAQYEDILKRVLEESVQELKGSVQDESHADNADDSQGMELNQEKASVKHHQRHHHHSSKSGAVSTSSSSKQSERDGIEDPLRLSRKRSDRDESSEDVPSSRSRRISRSVAAGSRSGHSKKDSEKSGRGSASAVATEETDSKTSTQEENPKKKTKRSRTTRQPKTNPGKPKYKNARAKPRIPQARSTVEEMQKRVAAILEFISITQVDIANEQSERKQLLDERTNRFRELFNCNETSDNFEGLITAYKVSLESMEGLTKKLINWEQQFGQYSNGSST